MFKPTRGSGCGSVGRFLHQRYAVPIQSPAKFTYLMSTVLKRRKQNKRGRDRPIF